MTDPHERHIALALNVLPSLRLRALRSRWDAQPPPSRPAKAAPRAQSPFLDRPSTRRSARARPRRPILGIRFSGLVAIRESLSIDNGEQPVLDGSWTFDSLADVFTKLNPDAKSMPSTILEADQRAAELRTREARQRAMRPIGATAVPSHEPSVEAPAEGFGVATKGGSSVAAAASCSADAYNDGWGANWFLDRFCNAGAFRWCPTNKGWANTSEHKSNWTRWSQMEGDFNLPGHISSTRISCTDSLHLVRPSNLYRRLRRPPPSHRDLDLQR